MTPWTVHQGTLLFAISWSLLRFMSIELALLSISSSAAPFSCCLQSFPASGSFPVSQLFTSGGPSIGASASALLHSSEYPRLISSSDWFDLLNVQGTLKSLLQYHSLKASVLQGSDFFMIQQYDYWKNHSFDYTDFCGQSDVSAF